MLAGNRESDRIIFRDLALYCRWTSPFVPLLHPARAVQATRDAADRKLRDLDLKFKKSEPGLSGFGENTSHLVIILRNLREISRNLAMRRASQTWSQGSLIAQLFLVFGTAPKGR
jgi:hypothetical protein